MADITESVSKNKLTDEKIRELAFLAFPDRTVSEIIGLNAGMCNALYRLTFTDGFRTVLKVSSPGMHGKASNERWLMESETAAMRLIAERAPLVKAPKVLFYDDSMTHCSGKYFFMEYVDGDLMMERRKDFTEDEAKKLYSEMGRSVRRIAEVKNTTFGIVNSGIEFDSLYGLVNQLIGNVVGDLERAGADMGVSSAELLGQLLADKPYFDEVTEPSLVHFDIWENNIIVCGDEIAGILDWERALWGEPLMEDRFRSYGMNPYFLEGFGQTEFTRSEQRRLIWYNIWINLAFMGEHYTRMYGDEDSYRRTRDRMLTHWNRLFAAE